MLKNYFKTAFRSFIRDKSFTMITLSGLSVGLACVVMILAYLRYELSYDKHYSNSSRVYRLMAEDSKAVREGQSILLPGGIAEALQNEFPEISAVSVVDIRRGQYRADKDILSLTTLMGGTEFFHLFNFDFVKGDPETALDEPGSIVLTEETADKLFPGLDPVGRTIDKVGSVKNRLTVTAVIRNIPPNTHISGDAIVSLVNNFSTKFQSWIPKKYMAQSMERQYILLRPGADPAALEQKITSIHKKYNFTPGITLHLQPVTGIHLNSHTSGELGTNSDIRYIYIFSTAGILILLIAMINYINLATARSLQRAREVGVRKVLGAVRRQLIMQFLSESFFFFFIALLAGIGIAQVLWPFFASGINPAETVPLFNEQSPGLLILICVAGGLLSGAYPAFIMSGMKSVSVMKGFIRLNMNISLRKALVVMQFVISGTLFIATLVVQRQLQFISDSKLGFNKDHLITVPYWVRYAHSTPFKNELKSNTHIRSVTVASWEVGKGLGGESRIPDPKDSTRETQMLYLSADPDFIQTTQMEMKAGSAFPLSYPEEGRLKGKNLEETNFLHRRAEPIILNETAVQLLELKDPVGKVLTSPIQGTVIGVVKDFNGLSLHDEIPAIRISISPEVNHMNLFIRIAPDRIPETIQFIETKWKEFYPEEEFSYAFVDESLQRLYESETRMASLFKIFSMLAIFIACLGLFGLMALAVQQRTKEISVRKVLGASVSGIVGLLSGDFLKLIFIAILIASPIAWWGMNWWLEDFAYRTEIGWDVFVLTGSVVLIVSFVTISLQTVKAALENPVNNLRSE